MSNDHVEFHEHPSQPSKSTADDATLEKAAQIFKALADPERLKLLTILAQGEACVSELADKNQMSTVSQRLKTLRTENLISKTREGKHIIYRLADQHIYDLIENALEHAKEKYKTQD